jgi:hypothetical protein
MKKILAFFLALGIFMMPALKVRAQTDENGIDTSKILKVTEFVVLKVNGDQVEFIKMALFVYKPKAKIGSAEAVKNMSAYGNYHSASADELMLFAGNVNSSQREIPVISLNAFPDSSGLQWAYLLGNSIYRLDMKKHFMGLKFGYEFRGKDCVFLGVKSMPQLEVTARYCPIFTNDTILADGQLILKPKVKFFLFSFEDNISGRAAYARIVHDFRCPVATFADLQDFASILDTSLVAALKANGAQFIFALGSIKPSDDGTHLILPALMMDDAGGGLCFATVLDGIYGQRVIFLVLPPVITEKETQPEK